MKNFSAKEEQNPAYTVSSRKWIAQGTDVYVKEFTLGVGECVPWHHHSVVFDVFYCLQGQLTIEREDVFSNERFEDLRLEPGEAAKVDVGTAHRPYNSGTGTCRFLIVQGVGEYDYLPFEPGKA